MTTLLFCLIGKGVVILSCHDLTWQMQIWAFLYRSWETMEWVGYTSMEFRYDLDCPKNPLSERGFPQAPTSRSYLRALASGVERLAVWLLTSLLVVVSRYDALYHATKVGEPQDLCVFRSACQAYSPVLDRSISWMLTDRSSYFSHSIRIRKPKEKNNPSKKTNS